MAQDPRWGEEAGAQAAAQGPPQSPQRGGEGMGKAATLAYGPHQGSSPEAW